VLASVLDFDKAEATLVSGLTSSKLARISLIRNAHLARDLRGETPLVTTRSALRPVLMQVRIETIRSSIDPSDLMARRKPRKTPAIKNKCCL